MAKKTAPLLPSSEALLVRLGERLRLARLRRQLSAKQVAERAGMTPMTLRGLERGGAGVTIGAYLAVMQVLGIEKDLDLVAKEDAMGRELQDSRLPRPKDGHRYAWDAIAKSPTESHQVQQVAHEYNQRQEPTPTGAGDPGYSTTELAALLEQAAPKRKK